jgi:hypothetical protein
VIHVTHVSRVTRKPDPETSPTEEEATEEAADDGAPSQKKERVLHTRVPAVLEQELKRFARNMRVPVSNVVRAILEDALLVADRASGQVEERLRQVVDVVSSEREQIREKIRGLDPMDDVIGFQPMVLAQTTPCARCRVQLRRGDRGWLGLTVEPGRRVIVCSNCVPPTDGGEDPKPEV